MLAQSPRATFSPHQSARRSCTLSHAFCSLELEHFVYLAKEVVTASMWHDCVHC